MLKLHNVSKTLGNFKLDNISMELPEGYIMGLIGPNGAGKTSLLHILLGLYRPEQGEVEIFGKTYPAQEHAIKNDIGYVLLDPLFCQNVSLLRNAQMYGKYYDAFEESVFSDYCVQFGLEPLQKLRQTSKGEQLKFQFAFALSHHPKLLILDEPTANFDPEFRRQFIHILTDYVKDGRHSVILSTHLTGDLDRIADYLMLLDHGGAVFCGDRETIFHHYRLVSGEDYKINLLPKEAVICKERGNYGSKALIRYSRWIQYDKALTISTPSVEELMYYMIKGGGIHVQTCSGRLQEPV